MHLTIYTIKALYTSAFISILIVTTNMISMESELKQRLLQNNPNDIHILIKEKDIDDCGICYEEREVSVIPCQEGSKHPKICDICLNGCNALCPYCRRTLDVPEEKITLQSTLQYGLQSCCLCTQVMCLPFYLLMMINDFTE